MKKYIDAERLKTEIEKLKEEARKNVLIARDNDNTPVCALWAGKQRICTELLSIISSLQQETPDKDTIIRICKLHKAWSIIAPWENIEDFITVNWNSKNIV